MDDDIIYLDPWDTEPLHEVRNQRLFDYLAADMEEEGWQGRPLLVIETEHGYVAWTGSHRIAAAREAELKEVPCLIVPEEDLGPEYSARYGHVEDHERLKILREIGNEPAAELMWTEGRL